MRRRFGKDYKLRILRETDACTSPGQVGAILRREGLYSSHLSAWRRQREHGAFTAHVAAIIEPVSDIKSNQTAANVRLTRENSRLTEKLRRLEAIIEVQKRLFDEMLRIVLTPADEGA
jgi:transposase